MNLTEMIIIKVKPPPILVDDLEKVLDLAKTDGCPGENVYFIPLNE